MTKYPKWNELFSNHIKQMVADVLIIKDHNYILAEGKIGYK